MPTRLSIDSLRGLACFLLVGFHVIGHNATTGLQLAPEHPVSQVNLLLSAVRMPLFTFLSGLVYALRPLRGPLVPFISGKFRRLLIPMLLVGTIFAAVQSLTPGTSGGDYEWRLLHVIPVAHYWFLEALFIIFILVALLERMRLLDTPGRFAGVAVAAALVHLTAPLPVYFGMQAATYLLPFFLLGVAAHRFHTGLSSGRVTLGLATVLVIILAQWAGDPRGALADPLTPAALAVSVCSCLLLLRWGPEFRVLAWIGRWSFGIYLFHTFFTAASRMALFQLGVQDLLPVFTAGMLVGIAGPILLTAVLRRMPFGHLPLGERPGRGSASFFGTGLGVLWPRPAQAQAPTPRSARTDPAATGKDERNVLSRSPPPHELR